MTQKHQRQDERDTRCRGYPASSSTSHTWRPPPAHPQAHSSPSPLTRWEVPNPKTIESRAGASAAAINHSPINHCHLAPRQPHPSHALSRQLSGMLGNEGWWGPSGFRLQVMLGRKQICVMWVCASMFTFTFAFNLEEPRDDHCKHSAASWRTWKERSLKAWWGWRGLGLLLTC